MFLILVVFFTDSWKDQNGDISVAFAVTAVKSRQKHLLVSGRGRGRGDCEVSVPGI